MDNGSRGVRLAASIFFAAIAVVLIWVVLSHVWIWRYQERVVFQPPDDRPGTPGSALRVDYRAADGHPLFGYVVRGGHGAARATGRTVVVAFHGNADLAAWQYPWAREVAQRTGATVFLAEYRGYAGLAGPPTYASSKADARAALEYLRSELHPDDVVLYGHSLGSAIATELAAELHPPALRALVLVSPFTSARDMSFRLLIPPIPGLWDRVARVHFDTRALVERLDSPVYVAHGSRDLNIPAWMGREVHDAARHPGELLIVDSARHNDVAEVGGERYWRWLTTAVGVAPVISGR